MEGTMKIKIEYHNENHMNVVKWNGEYYGKDIDVDEYVEDFIKEFPYKVFDGDTIIINNKGGVIKSEDISYDSAFKVDEHILLRVNHLIDRIKGRSLI